MTGNAGKRRDYNSDPGDGAEEPTEPTGVGRQRRTIKRPFSKRRTLYLKSMDLLSNTSDFFHSEERMQGRPSAARAKEQ